jgi:hypothetical protein
MLWKLNFMTMNRNKIKFKYLMNLWKSLPEYPTEEDIVYELSSYLIRDGRPNGEFTMQTFNSVFGPDWKETKHGEIVQKMIQNEIFEPINRSKSEGKTKYKIKEIPEYCK